MPRIGDKIKIIGNVSNHYYDIGNIYFITRIEKNGVVAIDSNGRGGEYLTPIEYEIVWDTFTIQMLNDKEKDLLLELNKEKFIVNYLEENNIDECSSNEIIASYMIHLFNSKNSELKNELVKILNEINSNFTLEKLNHNL